ncbi:MAG: nitroreductase A [Candidatus Methanofastidiosum methylothiophilum]|uniref:Nitroreductase A n=1 Tax=Candidatus Methanofastidiosum methylothiophilum TaxID=1705564 RepID=A0A150IQ27_9EURY|nr:MAG: nitroreductase A [Candidatus Methanofastidiosum methylthiophilus]KYC46998.1 MAG: nitroreductase A [Candidatus Methanofastidiosum methylthiophilus]KYC49385.1 MAG: nitroreductase A [Candidatus Methanofastidiosum methylthiophilus]
MGFDPITKRKTIRKFKDIEIEKEVALSLIEAAIQAPSAHNFQPWEFIIIDSDEIKEKLSDTMALTWINNLKKDGKLSNEINGRINLSKERITNAPIIIIPCFDTSKVEKYGDERDNAEFIMGIQSVALASENILLKATEKKLGVLWLCAPLFCPEDVRKVLDMPDHILPQEILIIGFPDENPIKPKRRDLSEVIHLNRW